MNKFLPKLLWFIALCLCLPAHSAELMGMTNAGATYRIVTPESWEPGDGLVVFNRGFRSFVETDPDLGPLEQLHLDQGFAVAASGLSQGGWALFKSADDNVDLVTIFREEFGSEQPLYFYGGSMGGLTTAQITEDPRLNIVGALPLCGVLGGTRVWDFALDLRLAYDVVCDDVSGAELPGGAEGYPFLLDEIFLEQDLNEIAVGSVGFAINACTGIAVPEILRSSDEQARLERLLALSNMSEEFFLVNMGYATLVLSDLYHDPEKLDLGSAVDNSQVVYADPEINENIARVQSNPLDRFYLRRHDTPSGDVGNTKIVALNTDKDDLVWLENLGEYQRAVPPAQLAAAVVEEDPGSHCDFGEAEVHAGWNALLEWTNNGSKPSASDMQADCEALLAADAAEGPCRITEDQTIGTFEDRFASRNLSEQEVDQGISGAWFDPNRSGEGWLVEVLDQYRVNVYWFTFPTAQQSGDQLWLIGEGRITDFGFHVAQFLEARGGRLGGDFAPSDIVLSEFTSMDFTFADCTDGSTGENPGSDNRRDQSIVRLTRLDGTDCNSTGETGLASAHWSGSWFDPDHPGEGWVVQALPDGRILVVWFSYDENGEPLWYIGTGLSEADGFTVSLDRPVGTEFGAAFDPDEVVLQPAGSLTFERTSCDRARIQYAIDATTQGEIDVTRLTQLLGVDKDC